MYAIRSYYGAGPVGRREGPQGERPRIAHRIHGIDHQVQQDLAELLRGNPRPAHHSLLHPDLHTTEHLPERQVFHHLPDDPVNA